MIMEEYKCVWNNKTFIHTMIPNGSGRRLVVFEIGRMNKLDKIVSLTPGKGR